MYGLKTYSLNYIKGKHFVQYFFISYKFRKVYDKAKLFDYLCVVQQLSNVQIHHNIQRNRIPENTGRPPGIHLC